MPEMFHALEESLKDFLAEMQNDNYNSRNANLYKYNNLKIFMEPSKNSEPHFVIRIGISEAMYNIISGEKMQGGLGGDERLIRKWIDKNLNRFDFNDVWKKETKVKNVSIAEDDDE